MRRDTFLGAVPRALPGFGVQMNLESILEPSTPNVDFKDIPTARRRNNLKYYQNRIRQEAKAGVAVLDKPERCVLCFELLKTQTVGPERRPTRSTQNAHC